MLRGAAYFLQERSETIREARAVNQRRRRDHRSKRASNLRKPLWLRRELRYDREPFVICPCDPMRQSGRGQQRSALPAEHRIAKKHDDGYAHPERLARRDAAVVGKWIERDVDISIFSEHL